MDLELAVSVDGRNWRRPFPGHRLLHLGDDVEFDCGMIMSATSPLIVGDDIHIYYGGANHRHDEPGTSSIGLATLKIDRWVGLQTGRHGVLETQPFSLDGSALALNAYAHGGEIRAELIDEQGTVLPGFGLASCTPFVGDHTAQRLSWGGSSDLASLSGQQVRLRFDICNAIMYAVTQIV
jgi:hypothetical protein